jgi:uncharacterized membrane protein
MTSSGSLKRRLRDRLAQAKTRTRLNPVPRLCVLVALFGVGAGFLAPEVSTREQANSLSVVFIGLLAANVAIIVAYVSIARKRNQDLRTSSLVILGLGSLVCVASLARLPLGAFQVTFALGVASFVYGLLATLVLLL